MSFSTDSTPIGAGSQGVVSISVSTSIAAQIAQSFGASITSLEASNTLFTAVVTSPSDIPSVPAGQVGYLVIDETTTANETFVLPNGYQFVLNESTQNIIIDSSGDPVVFTPDTVTIGGTAQSTGSTTMYGGASAGTDVASSGNNVWSSLPTGGGDYYVSLGSGNDSVYAASGDDTVVMGSGTNLVFLGSGADLVLGTTGSDTIVGGSGSDTVFSGSNDLVFGGSGNLLFVGGSGAASTVIAGSGAETLFGGNGGTGLFVAGNASSFMLDAGSSNDTVLANGSATVGAFVTGGGSLTLFSSDNGNALVAATGNATLNAAGTSGSVSFWAGAGNDSMVGGTGSDVFAFVSGMAHGVDVIANWNNHDSIALLGYGGTGLVAQNAVGGSDILTLSDGTTVTIKGVTAIAAANIYNH